MSMRVVIAEDEWLVATALRRQVELHGYEVIGTVGTGTEAVALCRAERPDVVLMDIQMPEMDGLEATRSLMEEHPTCVVIVTGRAKQERAAEQVGAMRYALKPLLGSQIPGLMESAQQRFGWFMAIREGSLDFEEAMLTWLLVQQAMKVLVDRDGMENGTAFARLQERAAEQGESLRATAEAVLREYGEGED